MELPGASPPGPSPGHCLDPQGGCLGPLDPWPFLYARQRRDILWDHPWRAGVRVGGRRPVLCPKHISKTTLPRVMKFHGWIDLIQGECSAQES